MTCNHAKVDCINPYEIIRKYRCAACGGVMMCSCEEEFAREYLPHQISEGRDLQTRERVPVTLGFQPLVCNTCRGLPEKACPKKPMHGSTSKVVRYYWREIQKTTIERFAQWVKQHGDTDWVRARATYRDQYKELRRQAIAEAKQLHSRSPKYSYDERSQSEVLADYQVPVVRLEAVYQTGADGRPRLQCGDRLLTPEEFVAEEFQGQGYDVLFTESVPFHAIFGVMMWLLIQDPADPRVQMAMFGDRFAFEERRQGKQIWAALPEDFGSSEYAVRRAKAIREHLNSLATDKEGLLWTFDYWVEPSASLRQYLWAHRPHDIATARAILPVLPGETITRILGYLVGDYWSRYCGWPDLLIHREEDFFFAEVKSSKDKLSEDQKDWIQGNAEHLGLPFKVVKIHRRTGS